MTAAVGDAAEPEAIHAMTTLAVVRGWGDDPEAALPLLREAAGPGARKAGLVEEWWRAVANKAVVLELLGTPVRGRRRHLRRDGRGARRWTSTPSTATCSAGTWPAILVDVGPLDARRAS